MEMSQIVNDFTRISSMSASSRESSECVTPLTPAVLRAAIRRRAEEIYVRTGKIPGHDVENWALAEREVEAEIATRQARVRKAIVVRVGGVEYVGEYRQEISAGYIPGELGSGAAVFVRFEGDKMFVRRKNGKELETVLVKG